MTNEAIEQVDRVLSKNLQYPYTIHVARVEGEFVATATHVDLIDDDMTHHEGCGDSVWTALYCLAYNLYRPSAEATE